jgi:hypothetical protein
MKNTNNIDTIHKYLISRLKNDVIHDFIEYRSLNFKNARTSISLSDPDSDVYIIISKMIKSQKNNCFIYEHELHNIGICSINPIHKDPLSQKFYHKLIINNKSLMYCNNCTDVMIRFSKKVIHQLGKIHYKKSRRLFLLIRKSSIYHSLVIDCFNTIFNLCLSC